MIDSRRRSGQDFHESRSRLAAVRDSLIKGQRIVIRGREPGRGPRGPFADQRSRRSTRRPPRGAGRGPGGHKLTHKGPPVINTRRTRGADCINCRRKGEQNRGAALAAQSEFKAAVSRRKMSTPFGLLAATRRGLSLLPGDPFAASFFHRSRANVTSMYLLE